MKKSNWILLFIIIILSILVYINNREESKTEKSTINTSFTTCDTSLIDKFEMKTSDDEDIILVKDAGKWYINQPIHYPANSSIIQTLLEKIANFKVENLISTKKFEISADGKDTTDLFKKFEVDSATGFPVKIYQNGELKTNFILGKIDNDYSHTYIRETNHNEVYLLTDNVKYAFKRRLKDWRDKTILKLDKDIISKVYIKNPEGEFILTKNDTLWNIDVNGKTERAKKSSVNLILSNLSNLLTADFNDTTKVSFDKPDLLLKVDLVGGKNVELRAVKKDKEGNKYYIQTSDKRQVFEVYKGTISVFLNKPEYFVEKKKEEQNKGKNNEQK